MAAIAVALVLALPAPATAVEVAPGVVWTPIVRERGPVRINVLELDPALVHGVLSNNRIAGRERVSRMGRRTGAVAGVNGGYFGPSGDPVGVLAIDGALLSEPVNGRSALVLGAGGAAVGPIRFSGSVTINGVERLIDGVERTRGLIPACGGRGGDVPTARPNAALTCTDSSELILLSPSYGARPPREGGVEAVLRDGTVARVRAPGTGPVPRDGLLLTGTGDAAGFLRDAALPRSRAEIELTLTTAGRPLDLAQQTLVVGGGPRLLRGGRVAVTATGGGLRAAPGAGLLRHVRGRAPAAYARRGARRRQAAARDRGRPPARLEHGHDAPRGGAADALPGRARCGEPRRRRLHDDDGPRRGREPALRPNR